MSVRTYIGRQHDRPDLAALNRKLAATGTVWRASAAKCVGLHVWNPKTMVCLCVDDLGYVELPDTTVR